MQRENKLKQHLYRQGFESEIINVIELDEVDVYDKEDELESLKMRCLKPIAVIVVKMTLKLQRIRSSSTP